MDERALLEKGWVKVSLWFEVLAIDKKGSKKVLKKHIESLKKVKHTHILKESYEKVKEIKKPRENIKKAYSHAVEVEIITKDLEILLFIVMFFAPSAVEIISPLKFELNAATVQTIMNSVADMMHRFAEKAMGGIAVPM